MSHSSPKRARQLLAQRREDALLVVDAEDVLAKACVGCGINWPAPARRPRRRRIAPGPSIGNLTSKRVRPGRLSTADASRRVSRRCAREIDRPRPVPSPLAFVVKNGSKMRAAHLGLDARARVLDRHLRRHLSPPLSQSEISPRPSMAWIALWMRLVHTWLSSPTYAEIGGKAPNDLLTVTPSSPYFN